MAGSASRSNATGFTKNVFSGEGFDLSSLTGFNAPDDLSVPSGLDLG
jgi:hypothetical protein